MYMTGKVTRKGQVTIPAQARKALGLSEGDKVSFVLRDGAVLVEKAKSWTERTKGAVKYDGPVLSAEELREATEIAIAEDVMERMTRNN